MARRCSDAPRTTNPRRSSRPATQRRCRPGSTRATSRSPSSIRKPAVPTTVSGRLLLHSPSATSASTRTNSRPWRNRSTGAAWGDLPCVGCQRRGSRPPSRCTRWCASRSKPHSARPPMMSPDPVSRPLCSRRQRQGKWWRWGRVELPVQSPSGVTTTSVSDHLCRPRGRGSALSPEVQSRVSKSSLIPAYATLVRAAAPLNDASTTRRTEVASTLTLPPKRRGRESTACWQVLRFAACLTRPDGTSARVH